MMRKYKRFIALLLVGVMFFSTSVDIFACTSDNNDTLKIVTALNSIEPIKNELGLSDVDFKDLSYSEPIIAYDYTDKGLVYDAEYIPILYINDLIGWVIKTEDGIFQFSTSFVDEIKNLDIRGGGFALIYSSDTIYLYDGEVLYSLASIPIMIENRLSLKGTEDVEASQITLTRFENFYDLQYTSSLNMRAPIYYSCNVSYVTQKPYDSICWAASAACIVNYLNGGSLTAKSVAESYMGTSFNHTLLLALEPHVLSTFGASNYSYKNQVPSDGIILKNIQSGYPVQANFKHSSGYHMVVVYGINVTGGYLYVMDPWDGFCATTYTASTGHTYYWPNGGSTYTLKSASCRYWSS